MSRRRSSDRVDYGSHTGDRRSSLLPRMSDREFKAVMYDPPMRAVYPNLWRAAERSPAFWTTPTRRFPKAGRPGSSGLFGSFSAKQPLFYINEMPSRLQFCVRRKDRREVLFARGKVGFRGAVQKRSFVRSVYSKYGC